MKWQSARPRVTLGVLVFNGEPYFASMLDSLLAQTYEDFELIISDNASTDRTGEISQDYAARDSRIRYVRNPVNIGPSRNCRQLVRLARSEYFRWCAADDLSMPTLVERCVEVLDREPGTVLAYPKTRNIDAEGRVLGDYDDNLHLQAQRPRDRFARLLEVLGYCNAIFGVARTAALRRIRPFGAYTAADVVTLAELSLYGAFWEVPEVLFLRRFHPVASSSLTDEERLRFYHPTRTHLINLHHWRHLYELTRGILHAPIPMSEQGGALRYLGRRLVMRRDAYVADVARAAGVVVRQLAKRAHPETSSRKR